MSGKIKVNSANISSLHKKLSTVRNSCDDAVTTIGTVRSNLDWQVTSRANIDTALADLQRRIKKQSELMSSYCGFLNTVNNRFEAVDSSLRNEAKGLMYSMGQITANLKVADKVSPMIDYNKSSALSGIATVGALFGAAAIVSTPLSMLREFFSRFNWGGNDEGNTVVVTNNNPGVGGPVGNLPTPQENNMRQYTGSDFSNYSVVKVFNPEFITAQVPGDGMCAAHTRAMMRNMKAGVRVTTTEGQITVRDGRRMAANTGVETVPPPLGTTAGVRGDVLSANIATVLREHGLPVEVRSSPNHTVMAIGIRNNAIPPYNPSDILVVDPYRGIVTTMKEANMVQGGQGRNEDFGNHTTYALRIPN